MKIKMNGEIKTVTKTLITPEHSIQKKVSDISLCNR